MNKRYLKKIVVLLNESIDIHIFQQQMKQEDMTYSIAMDVSRPSVFADGVEQYYEKEWEKGVLILSDCPWICEELMEKKIPVVGILGEQKQRWGNEFWKIPYVTERLNGIDVTYLERVYRRYRGIPWDILETKRCLLREITVRDVPRIAKIYQAPSVKKYMEPLYESLEKEVAYVEDYIKNVYGFYEYGIWVIIEKASGEIIGRAGIENCGQNTEGKSPEENDADRRDWSDEYKERIELGYVIEDDYQGKGFAYEVCSAILKYAKEQLDIFIVWTRIQKGNLPSIALCKKLGFTEEMQENAHLGEDMLLFRYETI